MKIKIDVDSKEFLQKAENYAVEVDKRRRKAISDVASEVLRLSSREVPHDDGTLQNSGHVEDSRDHAYVVYGGNAAPYAARLHENPQFRFQKGRKGKYLEDPIKNNLRIFRKFFENALS